MPESLAANADGDVYVSFWTDYSESVVRRFSADGAVLARWDVGSYEAGSVVAESGEGGVYVARPETDLVRHYSRDGQQIAQWSVGLLEPAIATAPQDRTAENEVYVIVSTAQGDREVRRYGRGGDLRASFLVPFAAHDLTVSPAGQTEGPYVFVAEGVSTTPGGDPIGRYRADGTAIDGWETSGAIAGMDVDGATGRLWVGYRRIVPTIHHVQEWSYDGFYGIRCELPGFPIDLTIGKGGDLYVLIYEDADRDHYREVRRYHQDCTLVDTWDLERLNRYPAATPTGTAPTATPAVATKTATGPSDPSDTPTTAPSVTYTPSPSPPTPSAAPTDTVAATPPGDVHVYLPHGVRNHPGPGLQVLPNSSWSPARHDGEAVFWGEVANFSEASALDAAVTVYIRDSAGNVLDSATTSHGGRVGSRAFQPHQGSCFEIRLFEPMPAGWASYDFAVDESAAAVRPLDLTVLEHEGEVFVDWMGPGYKVSGRLLHEAGAPLSCPTVNVTTYVEDDLRREFVTGCRATGPCPSYLVEPGDTLAFDVILYGSLRPYDDVTRYRVEAYGFH